MKSPAEAAYEAWRECLNAGIPSRVKPLELLPWSKLHRGTRAIWEKVAQAAVEADRGAKRG